LALAGIGQQIKGITRAHDAGASKRQGHSGGVNRDPAAPPLFGNDSRSAGTAGRIEHKVAGVGGHQEAALDDVRARLDNVTLVTPGPRDDLVPKVRNYLAW